jgi:hypothetical protein
MSVRVRRQHGARASLQVENAKVAERRPAGKEDSKVKKQDE